MRLLLDLFPVVAFFVAFRLGHAFPAQVRAGVESLFGPLHAGAIPADELSAVVFATAVAIASTIVQVGVLLARGERVKPMVWVSAALIVVFGGLTIWLQNEWFIKWKPSLLYWTFTAVLAGGRLFAGRNLLGAILGSEIALPGPVWDRLLWAWAGFFALLGVANLAVAMTLSTEAWVNFKTFGLLGLTLAFSIATATLISRHLKTDAAAAGDER
jgi:intracellular septation protein